MATYLPQVGRGPAPWVSPVERVRPHAKAQFPTVRTGSQRNFHRGWGGDAESGGGSLATLSGFAVSNASRLMFYAGLAHSISDPIEQDVHALREDIEHPPGLGAPATGNGGNAPNVKGPSDAATFGPIPKMWNEREDAFGKMPPLKTPSSERTTPTSGAPIGPKQFNPRKPGMSGPILDPAGRDVVGSRGDPLNLLDVPGPKARTVGRRGPAGMDPRKRGTWLNYE